MDFKEYIKEHGLKQAYLAKVTYNSRQSFSAKVNGKRKWNDTDIKTLKDLLGLTDEQVKGFFGRC